MIGERSGAHGGRHHAGRHRRGLNAVFFIALALVAGIGAWGLISQETMTGALLGFTDYFLQSISWYWLLLCTGFLLLSGFLAFGPYGKVRLGRDDERPEFATASWIAMLFVDGMGVGLLFVCYMLSAATGVDKGIKILSNPNMLTAITLLLVVIVFGPTRFIFETFVDTIGAYFSSLPEMAFRLFPYEDLGGWTSGWTLTYLIWWLAWGPFVGIFVARRRSARLERGVRGAPREVLGAGGS